MNIRLSQSPRATLALVGALFVALLIVATLVGAPRGPALYDLNATGSTGLAGLRLWLESMGFAVGDTGATRFAIPDQTKVLFVYPSLNSFTRAEVTSLSAWVRMGGVLVLIDVSDELLGETLGVVDTYALPLKDLARQRQPLLPGRSVSWSTAGSGELDMTDAPEAVTVLVSADDSVMMAVQALGEGVVWHLSGVADFTNARLRDHNEAALLPALLRTAPAGATVAFDTYHMFGTVETSAITTLQEWLYSTPLGWASLFLMAAGAIYLLLQGRRLGPPLPVAAESRRREAAEFVEAMASLQRRARQSEAVARHQRHRLKVALGKPLRLNPDLDDAEFIRRLAEMDRDISAGRIEEIRITLAQLTPSADEQTLVKAAAAIDRLTAP